MAGEIASLGYQGNLGFWGSDMQGRAKSSWWNTDMSDAGQALYSDPNSAVLAATVPDGVIAANQAQMAQVAQNARKARGGFMASLADTLHGVDSALSNIPGWGITKDFIKTSFYPVDKLASGAYWLYSNGISQPLSTLLIQSAKAETGKGGFWNNTDTLMSGDEWSDAYGKAEHISPAQAFMNYENTAEASGHGTLLSGALGGGSDKLSKAQTDAAKRNTERFLYDTDFWRKKQGWSYTVGTGALDFALSIGADPTYAGVKVAATAIKGARAIKVAEGAEKLGYTGFSPNALAEAAGTKIGQKFAKTPEEASRSTKVNNFFDWADGKTAAEIAQHPIWGRGRRVNPARDQLSQVFAHADRADMPLLMRFASGDNQAAADIVGKNEDLMIQLGKMQDNRVLVDSTKFDSDLLQSAIQAHASPVAPVVVPANQGLTNVVASDVYGGAARAILKDGTRGLGGAASTSHADIMRAEEWKASQLDLMNKQIGALQSKQGWMGDVMGSLATKVDDFSPGESNLFGTVKSLYRQGPLALRDTGKAGDKAIRKLGAGKGDKVTSGGFATRLIRNGFYTPATRFVQFFGEKLPERFIDHTSDDAYQRVAEMLKQVPGLGADTRLGMIRQYSQAGDKISRSKVLEQIHTDVVDHMAQNVHNLDFQTARTINQMRQVGFQKTMMALTGNKNPTQAFSAATADAAEGFTQANRVDHVEDGEGYVIAPLAKTQLQSAEPLLPVIEFNRLLKRNSGMLQSLKRAGGNSADNVNAALDSFNTMWKAATLLRPGYVLRSMSEEQVASAVKFGMMSSIMDSAHGGTNWALNRGQSLLASLGKGSYTSASGGGKSIIRILDPDVARIAVAQGLPTERIKVSKAWPVVQARISDEREALAETSKAIDDMKAKGGYDPQDLADLQTKAVDHQSTIDEHVDYATELLREAERSTGRRLGEDTFEHQGMKVPRAFSKDWEHPIPRDQITSAHAMETIFARGEAIDNGRLIKTGSWKVVSPDEPNHMDSWLSGLNKQFRQDELFRLVAQDPTLKTAQAWTKTPAGKYHMHQLGPRARDTDGTIQAIKQTIDQYLPEGTGLQAKLGRGEEILEPELRAAIAREDFPAVHGEELKALTAMFSKQTAARAVDDMIEKGFKRLGTLPNDVMARQPIYLRAQEARMRQLIDQEIGFRKSQGLDESLDLDDLQKMLNKSDTMARKDISQVVYDPTRTTATEALRFATPFLSAHIDGLQRWGGLIAESPQFLGTAAKVYNAPVAAGLVTDQYGRPVSQNGTVEVIGEDGKKSRQFVPIEQRMLTIRKPGETKNLKGVGKVAAGGVRLSLQSLNTILPGDPWFNPGTGPYAQIALSNVAKKSPAIGDFLQWAKVLPYGPSRGIGDAITPAYMKDAWDSYQAISGGTGEAYQDALLQEWQRQSADHANGGPAPDWDKVQHNAKQFMFLDALKNWVSPARTKETPLTQSPYQFFIDQYKTMQEVDPKNAKAQFFQKYGEDYFAFTASLSKSIGVQASLPAQYTAEKYGDLIAQDPDLAGLIVGDVYNQGKFSSSVYRKQMDETLNGVQERQKISALDAIKNNKKDMGWQQYSKYSNMLDAELIRSGFHSYNQAGAEALSQVKHDIVSIIAQNNEPWYEDYGTTSSTQLPLRIQAMKRLVSDPRIQADPVRAMDLGPLSLYLQQRDILKAQLAQRGGSQLSFGPDGTPYGQNADIGMQLRTLQLYLVNNSLGFGDIFHRYLESDDLS